MWQKMLQVGSGSGGGPSIEPFEVIIHLDSNFEGQAVTLSQSGQTPIIKYCPMTAPYDVTFKPLKDGVWNISTTTIDGTPVTGKTDPLLEWTTYEYTLQSGFNFTEWLTRGRVTETFSSLDDVLADETTIRQLMTVHDSVEYLRDGLEVDADSADTILNNKNCQKWINISNYALDTLQSNATVKALMDSIGLYGYGELIEDGGVMKPKGLVPVMTANDAPYGNVIKSSELNTSYTGWSAFNRATDNGWLSTKNATNNYIGYEFSNPCMITGVKVDTTLYGTMGSSSTWIVKGCNENTTDESKWDTIDTITINHIGGEQFFTIDNAEYYKCYKIFCATAMDLGARGLFLQFYGRSLSVSVPKMSGNNEPWGEASCKSLYTQYTSGAFNAFDRDTTLNHEYISEYVASGVTNEYIQYDFKKPVVIKQFVITNRSVDGPVRAIKDFDLVGTDDKGNETVIQTYTNRDGKSVSTYFDVDDANAKPYFKYKLHIKNAYADYQQIILAELQFYGLDYSEKEFAEDSNVKYIFDHGVELVPLTKTATSVLANIDRDSATVLRATAGIKATNSDKIVRGSGSSTFTNTTNPFNWYLDISSLNGVLSTGFSQVAETEDISCWLE